MGDAKNNPIAVLHAKPRSTDDWRFGFGYEMVVEPNEAAKVRIAEMVKGAQEAGMTDPRLIDFGLTDEDFDVVLYVRCATTRTSRLVAEKHWPQVAWRDDVPLRRWPKAQMIANFHAGMAAAEQKGEV